MPKKAGAIELSMEFPELTELRKQFKGLKNNIAAKHMGAALRKAMKPGVAALKRNTPKGPTGNLRKSIKLKIKPYYKDGNAVGLVGYDIGKGSKGFHQGFLEFGTKDRRTKKGRFASSWKRSSLNNASYTRAGFQIINPKRGKNAGKLVTNPKPPKAFFKSAKAGQQVDLGRMPIGGRTGVAPVKTSFAQARPEMVSILQAELATRLEKAIADAKYQAEKAMKK
jgi:HK97 gp10 family phage protein